MARDVGDDSDDARRSRRKKARRASYDGRSGSGSGSESEGESEAGGRARQPTLMCTMENVKLLVALLTCLTQGKKDQRVRCDVDERGMLFTAHSKGKSLQIKTSIGTELFESYEFVRERGGDQDADDADDTQLSFALDASMLVECLSIFGPSALATTSLRMTYQPEVSYTSVLFVRYQTALTMSMIDARQSASLMLVVEDGGVICECSMQVLEHEGGDMDQFAFESAFEQSAVVARCIMQSEPLHDAFAELYDLPSAASVTIAMYNTDRQRGPDAKSLALSAASETGSCEIDFAPTSRAFIEYHCAADDDTDGEGGCHSATFHVAVLQQAFKALAHSNETFLRMNGDGFLSVQHMIESGTGDKAFVDALISPEDTTIA